MTDQNEFRVSITFMSGPLDGKTMTWEVSELGSDLIITIGRRDGCDILLDYDSQVSRLHARVISEATQHRFFLEDANSRNGTFLSNEKIHGRVSLERGQLFRVGRTWLRIDPVRQDPVVMEDLEAFITRDEDTSGITSGSSPL
jgi:pSer/pThr/pTyr-binding forkhead associated (FHA) protein